MMTDNGWAAEWSIGICGNGGLVLAISIRRGVLARTGLSSSIGTASEFFLDDDLEDGRDVGRDVGLEFCLELGWDPVTNKTWDSIVDVADPPADPRAVEQASDSIDAEELGLGIPLWSGESAMSIIFRLFLGLAQVVSNSII